MIMQCDDTQWWWLWWFTVMMMMLCDDGVWWWWCTVMMHCDDDNARWWYWICTDLEFSSVRSTLGDSHRPKSEAVYQHWGPENSLGSKKTEVFSTNLKTESCTNSDEFSTNVHSFLITLIILWMWYIPKWLELETIYISYILSFLVHLADLSSPIWSS